MKKNQIHWLRYLRSTAFICGLQVLSFGLHFVRVHPSQLARAQVRQAELDEVIARAAVGQLEDSRVQRIVRLDAARSRARRGAGLAEVVALVVQLARLELLELGLVLDELHPALAVAREVRLQ